MTTLQTARLHLYPACLEDLEARLAMDRDPRVMRYIGPVPEDSAAHRERIRAMILGEAGPKGWFWHVETKADPGFLGWCGLFALEDSGLIEIGYRYVHAAWGRGIATEAAAAVLDHGFRVPGIDPTVAVTHPENRASQAVLRKIGLRPEGHRFHYGQELLFFSQSRADHLAAR